MRSKTISIFLLMSIFWIGTTFSAVSAAENLQFTMRTDSEAAKLGTKILQAAYQRLGIEITVSGRPGIRAIFEANNGASDGEVVRLKRVLGKYTNLRVVPIAIVLVDSQIASKNPAIVVEGWKTVKKYSAATVRGYRSIEQRIKNQEHIIASNVKAALNLVEHDRVEILVLSEFDLLRGLKAIGFKDIYIIEPEISRVELFHMLNKKHEALVPKITAVLKAMKNDGSHKKITDDFLAGYAE